MIQSPDKLMLLRGPDSRGTEAMTKQRDDYAPGCYQVKWDGRWTVAEFAPEGADPFYRRAYGWRVLGETQRIGTSDFAEIGPRIHPPGEVIEDAVEALDQKALDAAAVALKNHPGYAGLTTVVRSLAGTAILAYLATRHEQGFFETKVEASDEVR
jgi:hypothetical protein